MTKIFIIILNWNRPEDTIDCLKSIDKMLLVKGFELRVIVVDNGSTDESVINIKIYLQKLVSDTKKILRKGKNHLSQIRNNSLDLYLSLRNSNPLAKYIFGENIPTSGNLWEALVNSFIIFLSRIVSLFKTIT